MSESDPADIQADIEAMLIRLSLDPDYQRLHVAVERALAHLGLTFGTPDGYELLIVDASVLASIDETESLPVRIQIRPRSLELSIVVAENPSAELSGGAFWFEWQRPGEASFFMTVPAEDQGSERLILASRVPIPAQRVFHSKRLLAALIEEAIGQLATSRKKLISGHYGLSLEAGEREAADEIT